MQNDQISYPKLNVYLTVSDAKAAIDFYKEVFGAKERFKMTDPSGRIGHAELTIDDSLLMLSDEFPQHGKSPTTLGGTSFRMSLMVENADETLATALQAGATSIMPATDMFYGFRSACLRDPFGHEWMVQHKIADVSREEMQSIWEQICKDGGEMCAENKGDAK